MPRFRRLDFDACFVDGGPFIKKALPGGGLSFLRADVDCPALREAIASPDRLFDSARVLKDSRSSKAALAKIEGLGEVFVKRHNNKSLRYTLRHLFRKARSFRAWQAAWLFEQLGMPTPRILAAVAFRRALILQGSYLIQEAIPDLQRPEETVKALADSREAFDSFIAKALGHLALMHDCGLSHGDLKFSNLYASAGGGSSPAFSGFIDLDAVRFRKRALPEPQRLAELARLASSFIVIARQQGRSPDLEQTMKRFVDAYEKAGGPRLDAGSLSESVRQWIDKR